MGEREYIGDGLYVSHDGYHIWLETSDGISTTNRVALEPYAAKALALWARDFYTQYGQESPLQLPEPRP